jgi:hypothetical protein
MEQNVRVDDRLLRLPPIAWFLGVGLIIALIAILVFNVSINTVLYYSFIVLMFGGHLFMRGGHAGNQHGSISNTAEPNKGDHPKHTGGCH